jgi:hypothetical protein
MMAGVDPTSVAAQVAAAVAVAIKAEQEKAEAKAEAEGRALATHIRDIRYEFFMQQRMTRRRMCMRSCRKFEFLFVPPPPGT